MARPLKHSAPMPQIAVEEATATIKLQIPQTLVEEADRYAHYFQRTTGRRPLLQAHVLLGLIRSYLDSDKAFQAWKTEHRETADGRESPYGRRTE